MPFLSSSSSSPHAGVSTALNNKRTSFLVPQASPTSSSCSCCPPVRGGGAAENLNSVSKQQQQQHRDKSNSDNCVVLCPSCVHRYLQAARQRRQAVLKEHAALQRACREKFSPLENNTTTTTTNNNNDANDASAAACCNRLWQMQQEEWHQTWLPRWEHLRKASSSVAVQVARIKFENEQRNASLQIMARQNEFRRQLLYRWKRALLLSSCQQDEVEEEKKMIGGGDGVGGGGGNDDINHAPSENGLGGGAMAMAVLEARQQVRRLRFQWALHAFQLHKLHVGDDHLHYNNNKSNKNRDTAAVCRGIGKIGGCLPLPHAGPELYVFLPPPELQSALRLVASLTSMVAACLGILLPHPILLQQQQQQQSSSSSLHDSTPAKMVAANSPTVVNNAIPSTATMRNTTTSIEYTYCRDLAMRGATSASTVEQPNDYYHHHENEDWQEPFQNVATASTTTTTTAAKTGTAANKAATPTLSTSYFVSLAGQTFRRATGGGGGGTPTAAAVGAASTKTTTTTLPAARTVASSSNNDTRITTTTTRRQQEAVGSSHNNTNYNIPPPLSMDPVSVERRIHHATAAVLAENEHGSLYTLAAPGTIISSSSSTTGLENKRTTTDEISSSDHSGAKTTSNNNNSSNATVVVDADHFAIALQLLQNNVICLCIRAGVPVTNLWPAQAVLLNLQALQEFCQEQATNLSPILVHRR